MNRKQLTLLIVVGAVLGGLGWVAWQKEQAPYKESTQKMGGKVLPNFPLNDVEQMRPAIDAVRGTGTAVAEVALCYTADLSDPAEKLYTRLGELRTAFVALPETLADVGAKLEDPDGGLPGLAKLAIGLAAMLVVGWLAVSWVPCW